MVEEVEMGNKEGKEGTPYCGRHRDKKVQEENIKWEEREFRRFIDQ